jgi:uncharacterized protein
MKSLVQWKNENHSQSLLIKGARQVGKTYLIKEFGRAEFKHLLYINFEDQLDMRKLFEQMPNPNEAVNTLQAYGIANNIFNIEKEETLIFFDEIQLCRRAYSLIKPLTEMSRFKIIASGSLLGLSVNGETLDPGPTMLHLEMKPMDFEEFLLAIRGQDYQKLMDSIKQEMLSGQSLNESIHKVLNDDIKTYTLVGGMPQVVFEYIESKDLAKVYLKQQGIVQLYRSDIQQYQSSSDNKVKSLKAFDSIPQQFSKKNHRFMYSVVEQGKKGRDLGEAIDWLDQTGNTNKCYHLDHVRGSLIDGRGSMFKLYMNDIGLLVSMLGQGYIYKIIHNQMGIFNGALYEQLIAQMLIAKGLPLYYKTIYDYEIDFLIEIEGELVPVECKSGGNTKSKSLRGYLQHYQPRKAFKISSNNLNFSHSVIKAIPHYMFALLTIEELMSI